MPTTSGILSDLEKDVENRCVMKSHADAPALTGGRVASDVEESSCYKAGTCLCGENADAEHIHKNFVALFKPFLRVQSVPRAGQASGGPGGLGGHGGSNKQKPKPKKPVARLLMEQGMVVLKFVKCQIENEPVLDLVSCWQGVAQDWVDGREMPVQNPWRRQAHQDECHWVHVAFTNFRDWKFSFLLMHQGSASFRRVSRHGDQLVELRVPADACFLSEVAFFKRLNLASAGWKASLHCIATDMEPLPDIEMAPDTIEVKCFGNIPELNIWKARLQGRGYELRQLRPAQPCKTKSTVP